MFEIVPLEEKHLKASGHDRVPVTIRGVAVIEGEQVLLMTGLYLSEGCMVMGSKFSQEFRTILNAGHGRKALLRAGRAALAFVDGRKLPVYAVADPEVYGSARLLEHLGFIPDRGNIYKWQSFSHT